VVIRFQSRWLWWKGATRSWRYSMSWLHLSYSTTWICFCREKNCRDFPPKRWTHLMGGGHVIHPMSLVLSTNSDSLANSSRLQPHFACFSSIVSMWWCDFEGAILINDAMYCTFFEQWYLEQGVSRFWFWSFHFFKIKGNMYTYIYIYIYILIIKTV